MALVSQNEPMSIGDIRRWLSTTFGYFAYAGIHLNNDLTNLADYDRQRTLGEVVVRALDRLELPVVQLPPSEFASGRVWQVSIPDTRAFLQGGLFERKGTFPLLRLPTEIRIMIWEMVLRYPPSGIRVLGEDRNGRKTIAALDKDYSTPFISGLHFPDRNSPVRFSYKQPLEHSLSLLSVNKQIFEESFASFYRINLFVFPSVTRLAHFLRNTPPSRRQHLTQLAFEYSPVDRLLAPDVFSDLASLNKLKTIYVHIDSAWWSRAWGRPSASGNNTEIDHIPGLDTLRKLRGLDHVEITGMDGDIEEQMKSEMEEKVSEERSAAGKEMKD